MLTLTGVVHVYASGTRALDDASLTISKGMFGLLDPDGAGKATLMRCVATLQTPSPLPRCKRWCGGAACSTGVMVRRWVGGNTAAGLSWGRCAKRR